MQDLAAGSAAGAVAVVDPKDAAESAGVVYVSDEKRGIQRVQVDGVKDGRVARIVKACQELPGQELFQYIASRP